ncbi:hypothetical protein AALA98_14035 [Lachnospiraceae bacterium 45-W7]
MSSIDLVILGIVLEKPQSAYDIQKDVDYHHFSRWTKISVLSIAKLSSSMKKAIFKVILSKGIDLRIKQYIQLQKKDAPILNS